MNVHFASESTWRPGCDDEILPALVGTCDDGPGYAARAVLLAARDGLAAADADPRLPSVRQQPLFQPLPPGLPWQWRPWPAWTRRLPFSSSLPIWCSHHSSKPKSETKLRSSKNLVWKASCSARATRARVAPSL